MARRNTRTRWVIAAAVAVVVVAASIVVIALALRSDPPTEQLDTTTVPTTAPTTTVVPTTRDGATTTTEPAEVAEERVPIRVGELDRRYTVVTPLDARQDEQLPTVVVLHGLGVSAEGISRTADWRHAVERERFVAVFPQGEGDSWNVGPCCLPASLFGVDDMSYLDAVMDELAERPDVDEDRMYLTGFSNGGLMTYAYACRRPELFAAVAPMAGSNVTRCEPDQPVSLQHQHSDPDSVVPYDGGLSFGQIISSEPFPDVPSSVGRWATASGCGATPTSTTDDDGVEFFAWPDCPGDTRVELVRIPERGHVWPTRGDYDPLATLLEFFGMG